MLHIHHLEKSYGGKKVLDGISLQINPGEKAALIGSNGTGKTTLLKIILGEVLPDGGQVIKTGGCRVACLAQEVSLIQGNTLLEEMRQAMPDILEMERRLQFLEDEMTRHSENPDLLEDLVEEYSLLLEKFHHQEGHDLSWKIDAVIQGLGFSLDDRERSVSEFSGGWQMRIQLAKLLLQEVDLLLLDEPTNHLDLKAVEWLESYLKDYPGAVIIVSHDRYFLNRATSYTLHLERGKLKTYPGNYDFMVKKRTDERDIQEQAHKTQQKKLQKDLRFIERFRAKATLATRVKSREKMVEKMDIIEAPESDPQSINFNFQSDEKQLSTVYKMIDLSKSYPGLTVTMGGDVEIGGGQRVALVGRNGCGKTTLLKILSGIDKDYQGRLKVHFNARIRYYMQNQAEQLNEKDTVLESLEEAAPPGTATVTLRTLLGSFLFKGDDVFKRVSVLSGGEKSRLALARMICSRANVLLLDEPTNHLDIESREALAEALDQFHGTIIVVSHDRYFLDQVCSRVIEIEDGTLTSFQGNFTYYRDKKKRMEITGEGSEEPVKKKKNKKKKTPSNGQSTGKIIREKISRIEETISLEELELTRLEEEMGKPENVGNEEKMSRMVQQYGETQNRLETLMQEWEEMHEEMEAV